MSEAAPEQAGIAECFHIGQDTGTCGRKAGDRLEESINIKRNLSGENEGNSTENRHDKPSQGNGSEAFPDVQFLKTSCVPET